MRYKEVLCREASDQDNRLCLCHGPLRQQSHAVLGGGRLTKKDLLQTQRKEVFNLEPGYLNNLLVIHSWQRHCGLAYAKNENKTACEADTHRRGGSSTIVPEFSRGK